MEDGGRPGDENPATEQCGADLAEQVAGRMSGWVSELDTCDAYIVVLGHPRRAVETFGPYSGRDALHAADHLADVGAVPAHVVRLHHPRP